MTNTVLWSWEEILKVSIDPGQISKQMRQSTQDNEEKKSLHDKLCHYIRGNPFYLYMKTSENLLVRLRCALFNNLKLSKYKLKIAHKALSSLKEETNIADILQNIKITSEYARFSCAKLICGPNAGYKSIPGPGNLEKTLGIKSTLGPIYDDLIRTYQNIEATSPECNPLIFKNPVTQITTIATVP